MILPVVLAALALAAPAAAHDGEVHATPEEAARHLRADGEPLPPVMPLPVEIEARFDLVDQTGARRTQDDFAGRPYALFFGYASCEAICSVALPRLAEAVDMLAEAGFELTPVLVTVDPDNDTPKAMAEALPRWHPRMVGLTGSDDALSAARAAFQASAEKVSELPDGTPIYAHGSFVYLVGPDGRALTLVPPILSAERMAEIFARYL